MTITMCLICAFTHGQLKDTISDYEMITFIEKPPIFSGDLSDFIREHLIYPQDSTKDSIEGEVIVSFWIDTLGKTIEHIVMRGISKDIDEEALRVTRLIKFEKPAMQKGKPIRIKYTLPVVFELTVKGKPKKKGCGK